MVDDASVIFSVALMFGAAFGQDIARTLAQAAMSLADHIRARTQADIAAAPRDSFPGLSHTAEKERGR